MVYIKLLQHFENMEENELLILLLNLIACIETIST